MESKLEQLINKLENLVDRFEKGQGSPASGSAPAQTAGSQNKILRDFDNQLTDKIKAFEAAAQALGGDVIPTITEKFVSVLLSQKDVIFTMQSCKKPADIKFLLAHAIKASGDVKALKNKDAKLANHVQTVADGFNLFGWFGNPALEEYFEENLGAIDFYGFKVLQLKQDPDTTWYKAYKDLAKTFGDFLIEHKTTVINWSGQGPDAAAFFGAQLGKSESQFRGGSKTEEKKGGGLLDEIQEKSLAQQSNLKHVEKNAHKKDGSQPLEPVQKKEPVKREQKVEVKKDPKKNFQMNTWYIENWGKEVLKYEGDDVQPNYGWALIKCQDTTLVVDGKCKTIMLENCQNVKVIVNAIMANVEVINSKKISVTIKEKVPQINVERSHGVQLFFFPSAKNAKVHSTCSTSLVLNYPKEGAKEDDEWLDIAVPETYITQIKNDKVISEPLEGME